MRCLFGRAERRDDADHAVGEQAELVLGAAAIDGADFGKTASGRGRPIHATTGNSALKSQRGVLGGYATRSFCAGHSAE